MRNTAIVLSAEEEEISTARSNEVDHEAVDKLHYLGNMRRMLPVSMTRMIENAYDWEHLPFVHASSFSGIELIESGTWGWRARAELPPAGSGQHMLIELVLDEPRDYWATSTLTGATAGVQIHTQATSLSEHEIEIDVRFYLDAPPPNPSVAKAALASLTELYTRLYDEDVVLMSGRQSALDSKRERKNRSPNSTGGAEVLVGDVASIRGDDSRVVEMGRARFCVRRWREDWIVYGADCPHLLGPLEDESIGEDGSVTCPWHGYRFDVASGANHDGKCGALAPAPRPVERDGKLYLVDE